MTPAPAAPSAPAAPESRRIVVLRHGRTAWNVAGRFQGAGHPDDPPLDDVGWEQARAAGRYLAGVGATALLSSPLRRAWQTAGVVAAATGLEPVPEPRLREQSFGAWEGLTRPEIAERFPDGFAAWLAGRDPVRPGGESRPDVAVRLVAAVDALPVGSVSILVTHGAAATALVAALLGLDDTGRRIRGFGNCHVSSLGETGAGWTLRDYNVPTWGP